MPSLAFCPNSPPAAELPTDIKRPEAYFPRLPKGCEASPVPSAPQDAILPGEGCHSAACLHHQTRVLGLLSQLLTAPEVRQFLRVPSRYWPLGLAKKESLGQGWSSGSGNTDFVSALCQSG